MTLWLADALRSGGCRVSEVAGWRNRGRPGAFAPFATLNHHTATPTSAQRPAPTLNLCINGRPDLPGPLCQVMIGWDGTCHVIAAGRANHAGAARNSPPVPAGDGNAMMIGFEWDYSGLDPPSRGQYDAAVAANAAVLRQLGRPASFAKGHRETSTEGKWDPGQVDLDRLRADIAARLGGAVTPPPLPEEDDMAKIITCPINTGDKAQFLSTGVHFRWLTSSADTNFQLQAGHTPGGEVPNPVPLGAPVNERTAQLCSMPWPYK